MIATTIDSTDLASQPAKLAAMAALAALSPFEPVASVAYQSAGRLLIIGSDERVAQAVTALNAKLSAAVFWTGKSTPPALAGTEVRLGSIVSLTGFLGAFELLWQRGGATATEVASFDLVLDLQASPLFQMPQPPQGYLYVAAQSLGAPDAPDALAAALAELPEMVGEFEKPKFFAYKESICAHSRSRKIGCTKCIDICSTKAILSNGDSVIVDPHLCMGCGGCATVCPSGAMSYQYPRVADRGAQLRALLGAYSEHKREHKNAATLARVIVFHNGNDGASAMASTPLAANVLPVEAWHIASIGLDVLLGAVSYGAAGVIVVSEGSEAPAYADAIATEMRTGDTILAALGYIGSHFALCGAGELADQVLLIQAAASVSSPATFHLSNDKRATLEFAIEHLARHAPIAKVPDAIPLAPMSMWGNIVVNQDKCTMCLACAGACPESALMDGGEGAVKPQLKFIERNCVQCGICATTCPEKAITLEPRLLLSEARKKAVLLNETEPFNCISCGEALGTRKLIDAMLGKLAGHSMFQAEGSLKRLQMCADCRVVDMMSNKHEMSILTGKPIE
ncbi:MAG: 4Fe-4S binding protein [Aeromicrobium sp.]|nr:4Fe-4S binding protein [Burkholderiales bacterium]